VPPRNTTGLEGSRVSLDCEWAASPANVTQQWFHNGVDVRLVPGLMSRAQINSDGSLVIVRALRDDTGWYRCRPTNGLGRPPTADAYLNVTCTFAKARISRRRHRHRLTQRGYTVLRPTHEEIARIGRKDV